MGAERIGAGLQGILAAQARADGGAGLARLEEERWMFSARQI
ncbi:MAG: hypothetical protein JWM19_1465 [Actinomycetia bacterium]|nr:hypothetical protein [Actinomycetes bacterium]